MDVILAILLSAGCVMCLPIYWWLFMTPMIRLGKLARQYLNNRIL